MDLNKPKSHAPAAPTLKLSNGYILPEGKLTPNALFVGGIDMKVGENEMKEFFARYGPIKEVKIITYRGGVRKGYGFVYFNEDVNIQAIIDQQISFNGRKLKLGPAIMKERTSRSMPSHFVGGSPWGTAPQYVFCACCSAMGCGVTQPPPLINGASIYNQQPYPTPNFVVPQMPINYAVNPYPYQYAPAPWTPDHRTHPINQSFVDCGVQTLLTVQ